MHIYTCIRRPIYIYTYIYIYICIIYIYIYNANIISLASFVDDCRNGSKTVLFQSSGYLALYPNNWNRDLTSSLSSSAAAAAGASFSPCPWTLVAEPGERFNVTWRLPSIFHQDFQEYPEQPSPSSSSSAFQCSASWKFLDSGDETQYAACVSNLRRPKERSYISKTNRLEVHYTGSVVSISGLFHKHPRLPVLQYTGKMIASLGTIYS